MKTYEFEKKLLKFQMNSLKNKKFDPNNVVLNAAAFQDQLNHKFGININKRRTPFRKKITLNEKKEKTNMVDQYLLKKNTEEEIMKRNRKFLSNLTFAEKVGVQKIKNFPLSLNQWKKVEEQTIKREDYKGECPICLDKLACRESVILSCSHVFHKVCLQNFEKFSSVTKCPLCRCERYECKTYIKDKEYFVNKSVLLLQKYIRGYVTRYTLYKKIFKKYTFKSKRLRSLYSYWRIRDLTDKMTKYIEEQNKYNEALFKEVCKENEELIRLENKNKALMDKQKKEMEKNQPDWNGIINKMEKRNNNECAICLCNFGNKPVYILDCTHCFHKNCLDAFERFDPYYIKRCPICRNNYTKKQIYKHDHQNENI